MVFASFSTFLGGAEFTCFFKYSESIDTELFAEPLFLNIAALAVGDSRYLSKWS